LNAGIVGVAVRNLSLKHIETVQAIAVAGSLVRAAATLNMTPAALTARVKALEEAVDLKLFDRTSTGMRLTKAGEAALEASRAVERAVRDFTDAMLAISTGEGGRLSVGAVSTAKYFAPRLIAAFVATRPKVDLRFQIGNRDATVDSLRNGEIEIALA
jgi:DNA-binding transcriptional LysR family regulator